MKRKITILFFLLFLPTFIMASTVGRIQGKVTDLQSGEALIGANVIVVGTNFGAATDVSGAYSIGNLQPGVYTVKASYLGYKTVTVSNVRVNVDLTTEIDFKLPTEGISVGQVNIVAKRPLINKSNTNAIRNTTSEKIEALPIRGVTNIIGLTPGVVLQNGTIFVRGGRSDEVGFFLEGTNITNPVFGGRTVTIVQDAVEEISVQAGGFNAEFGGANAGIVRTQLKSGTPDFKATVEYVTDNLNFKGKSNRFDGNKNLGAFGYGYNEFIGTVSGPVFSKNIKFFGLFDYNYQLDQTPRNWPGMNLGVITDPLSSTPGRNSIDFTIPAGPKRKNSREAYTGTATLTLDFNPIIIRATGTWTNTFSYNTGIGGSSIFNILNYARTPEVRGNNGAFSLKLTDIISPTSYFEITAGYSINKFETSDPLLGDKFFSYGDSTANANVGAFWASQQRPATWDVLGFSFADPNDLVSSFYSKRKSETFNANINFSTQLGKYHSIKIGGEGQFFKLRNYSINAAAIASRIRNNQTGKSLEDILTGLAPNAYGFGLRGFESGSKGLLKAKKPVFIGAYIQDRIEYKNLILNIGLRFDYIDIDNFMLVDPTRPELTFSKSDFKVNPDGLLPTPTFSAVSPRLGFSFPVTDRTVFHAQFGQFVQQSRLRDVYNGILSTSQSISGGNFIGAPVGFNVRPTRTTQYEVGFTQQLSDFASFDITAYYKDIKDNVTFKLQTVAAGSPFGAYNVLTNGDFATTKGVEIAFNMRRVKRLQINGSVSFQDAQGTGSNPNSHAGIVGAPLDGVTIFNPLYVFPLDNNKSVTGNFNLDYRFSKDEESPILRQLGLSALMVFASGHPYTKGFGKGNNAGSLEGDARFRQPLSALNASTTPWTYQLDVRLDKTFSLFDRLKANVYVFIQNILDTQNVTNVFLRTGSAFEDGYLGDPSLGGTLHPTQRQDYENLYRAINIDYQQGFQNATGRLLFGPSRQIRVGVRLEY